MPEATTRERITMRLRESPATATVLSEELSLPRSTVYHDLKHVAQSVSGQDTDEELLVAPPECRNCGFSRFDEPINRPSRCPDCRSESIDEAVFTIR